MSILLQIPSAGDLFTGLFGQSVHSDINGSGDHSTLVTIVVFILFFLSLTEPLKVLLRRNIGRKALNLFGIIMGSSFYLTWALSSGYFIFDSLSDSYSNELPSSDYPYITLKIYLLLGSLIMVKVAFDVLRLGINEYYRAKAEDSNDWQVLEYRGDPVWLSDKLIGRNYKKLWLSTEPKYCIIISSVLLFLHPIIGLPAFFTSLSFWLNEWYHVRYKPYRLKRSFLDMKIEMQKADIMFSEASVKHPASKTNTE